MKALLLSNNYAGIFAFRKEVIKALIEKGYEVYVAAPFDEKAKEVETLGCKLINTPFNRKGTNPIKDMLLIIKYKKLIKQVKPQVVLSYTIKPNLYGGMACQMCGVPQIANITGLGSAVENPGWFQKLTKVLYKIGLRKAKTVFFQNKANMEFCVQNRMVKGNIQLIPGSGVNLLYHAYQPYPAENETIRFVYIGRLMREKGIDEYLAAAKIIRDRYPNTEFNIVGGSEDNYQDQIMKLQNDGVIIYHGSQLDVRPYIGKAWCTIHPSFYPEGMSNVLLESCAAGRPIITTDRPGCGEIVEDYKTGYLVKAQAVDDLVDKIERFIALPYEQKQIMGKNARAKVEREFDRQIVVNAYLKEIEGIANV